jgi:hypothetical protein
MGKCNHHKLTDLMRYVAPISHSNANGDVLILVVDVMDKVR